MAAPGKLINLMDGQLQLCVHHLILSEKDPTNHSPSVVCPVSLVSQWASEIQKMTVGLRVIEHHGATRTTGWSLSDYSTYSANISSDIDPSRLKQAHVVVTSYSIVSSEHGAFIFDATDEGKGKSKSKKQASSDSESDDDSDNSDSSSENFGKTIRPKKKAAPKKQSRDALFRIKWWRIVLGKDVALTQSPTRSLIFT